MRESEKMRTLVLAAGGIVVRMTPQPLIAIVRVRKTRAWTLPKGKLKPGEDTLAAAKREVMEETGQRVTVHEFLGSLSHTEEGRHKIVQFWRMQPVGGPTRALGDDIMAVKWLPLKLAIETLSRARERVFLAHVGPMAVRAAREAAREALARAAERVSTAEDRELLEAASRAEPAAPSAAAEPELTPATALPAAPAEVAETLPVETPDGIDAVEAVHIDAQTTDEETLESEPDPEHDGEAARPRRRPLVNVVRAWIARRTQYLGGRQN